MKSAARHIGPRQSGRRSNSRQLKKIHRRWLESDIIDLTQHAYWRKRLFESAPGEVFVISVDDITGLTKQAAAAVQRYKLHFSVQKVDSSEAQSWLSEGGSVVFKFWATAYPTVRRYSGNNPNV